jgi:hypothetical protein
MGIALVAAVATAGDGQRTDGRTPAVYHAERGDEQKLRRPASVTTFEPRC